MHRPLSAILLVSLGCGGSGGDTGPSASYELPTDVSTSPSLRTIPFPSDLFVGTAGTLEISVEALPFGGQADPDAVQNLAAALSSRDCFSVIGGVTFPIAGLESGEQVDLESARSVATLRAGDAELEIEVTVRPEGSVVIEPARGVVLDAETTYIAALGAGLTTSAGRTISPSELFSKLAAGDAADGPWQERAQASLASALRGDEIVATSFTTCAAADDLQAIAQTLDGLPSPVAVLDRALTGAELDELLGTPADNRAPGIDNDGGPAHADIDRVILGRFNAPSYLAATAATQGAFERDGNGVPSIKGTVSLPFILVLPSLAAGAADIPVAIFQHGLNGSADEVFSIANSMAAAGFATIAIDLPFHGSRFPDATDKNHNFTDAAGPDGLADSSGGSSALYFFDILNQPQVTWLDPSVMADSFRQAAVDVMSVARLLDGGDFSAIAASSPELAGLSFRGDKAIFVSESFGGFVGVPALAFEPRLAGGFLSVGGGGLAVDLLETSAVYGPLFMPIVQGAFAVSLPLASDAPPHTHIIYQLLSQVLEGADPLAYAASVRARQVPVVLATAHLDESVPNNSSEALAAALGLAWQADAGEVASPQWVSEARLPPAAAGARTGIVFSRDPASHGMLSRQRGERRFELVDGNYFPLDPVVMIANPVTELQDQLAAFAAAATGE